ncbi:hypothetical protein ACFU5Y_08110 [Streptomyces gardneri]|uniref:hypothetical protein n=1 Tax=Streptomyces gardneri TaxID=66892 RepID=UPI0036D005C8
MTGPGGRTCLPSDPPVSQENYDRALAYFEERARWSAEREKRVPADGPATPHAPAVRLHHSFPNKQVADPGYLGLRNDYRAPISVGTVVYPSVAHAYWALSVAQPEARGEITAADNAGRGRNWTGRLLELVRAELHLRRNGIPGL